MYSEMLYDGIIDSLFSEAHSLAGIYEVNFHLKNEINL